MVLFLPLVCVHGGPKGLCSTTRRGLVRGCGSPALWGRGVQDDCLPAEGWDGRLKFNICYSPSFPLECTREDVAAPTRSACVRAG